LDRQGADHAHADGAGSVGSIRGVCRAAFPCQLSVPQEKDLQKQWNDVWMLQNQIEINRKNIRALQSLLKISDKNCSGGFWRRLWRLVGRGKDSDKNLFIFYATLSTCVYTHTHKHMGIIVAALYWRCRERERALAVPV
jgi:hypothetical protein